MLLQYGPRFSFRLFRKKFGQLARCFWANGFPPPLAKNFPYAYVYETYNICEIVGQSRLAKFSIRTLQNICSALELDVASITGKRKQPYMEIIEGVVARCGYKTSKTDQNM